MNRRAVAVGLLAIGLLGGCGGIRETSIPTPSLHPAVVTPRAADGSTWRLRLIRPADVQVAGDLLAGLPGPRIPNGRVVRGSSDVNAGWSWHIDPLDFEWSDVAAEVCDGNPGDVESGALTSDRYCPWAATVIAVDPTP